MTAGVLKFLRLFRKGKVRGRHGPFGGKSPLPGVGTGVGLFSGVGGGDVAFFYFVGQREEQGGCRLLGCGRRRGRRGQFLFRVGHFIFWWVKACTGKIIQWVANQEEVVAVLVKVVL